jgi:hypothetical protein
MSESRMRENFMSGLMRRGRFVPVLYSISRMKSGGLRAEGTLNCQSKGQEGEGPLETLDE